MLIFYVDECGDTSLKVQPSVSPPQLKSGTSALFVLAGVGVRDTSRKPLAEAIFALKKKHFGAKATLPSRPWSETEIKGRYLYRASRNAATGNTLMDPIGYRALTSNHKVNVLLKDLGMIFARFRPLIFATVVDKRRMLAEGRDLDPVGVAYAYLHQRIAEVMGDVYAGDAAIIVADQQTQHERFFRTGEMSEIRKKLTSSMPRKPNHDLVLDKPLWVDTDLSSWDREIIQLADIVAYTVTECVKNLVPPTEFCYLWEYIEPRLAVHWQTGHIIGGGIAIYPKSAPAPKMS